MALLADTQYGFPGSVTPTAWASIIGNASGGVFGVAGLNDLKLSVNAVGDRGALLSTGTAYGHGCLGIWTSTTQFNFAAASGTSTRWDCVVVRRTWSNTPGASVTTLAVLTGTSSKALPSLQMNPGVVTEQPLWLVRVKGGQTAIQELVDLRCFSANGGVQAMDSLALGYLNLPGSRVEAEGDIYEYKVASGSTSAAWEKISGEGKIASFGNGPAIGGNASSFGLLKFQAGSTVQKTDGAGYGRITWPTPFPNGLLTVLAFNGDDNAIGSGGVTFASSGASVHGASKIGGKNDWVYVMHGYATGANDGPVIRKTNTLHRINWIAIGF